MTKTLRNRMVAVIGLVAVALVVVACGGSSNDSASSSSGGYGSAKPAAPSTGAASVGLRSTGLGKILVDGKGKTLYLFEADKGMSSTCDSTCATEWPPLTTTGKPTAGTGVIASKLGTTKRADGKSEVTYNGHPLYTYLGDQAPGQATGQGSDSFGAEWFVLSRAGKTVERGN